MKNIDFNKKLVLGDNYARVRAEHNVAMYKSWVGLTFQKAKDQKLGVRADFNYALKNNFIKYQS